MKKSELNRIIICWLIVGLIIPCFITISGCGPSAEEKAALEKAKNDSIEAVKVKLQEDSMLAVQKMKPDSIDSVKSIVNIPKPDNDRKDSARIKFSHENAVSYKPNIYLYPESKIQISVNVSFPQGGEILKSDPAYGNGWNVSVDTNSMIDGKFNYLFYESTQPDVWQTDKGWLVKRIELRAFFVDNMAKYGFNYKEIVDFVVYWVPRLQDYEYYEIYPQETATINSVIALKFSVKPDNILRLFYVIKGTHSASGHIMKEPVINSGFARSGFYVAEWGVVL
jgi:hypothetical protein